MQCRGDTGVVRTDCRELCTAPYLWVMWFSFFRMGVFAPGKNVSLCGFRGGEVLLAQAVQQLIRMVHLIQQRLHLGGTVPGRLHHRKTSQIL